MRPIKLIMRAFGPYVDETVVDFDALNNGVFLITGETGAGKTMIFDAMTFALFGKASGKGRSNANLHSDYCPKEEKTSVTFIFEHNGKKYEINRTISYKAKEDKFESGTVHLTEEGEPTISKGVPEKISEILNLNSEQFSQIVMLAQGEFQKFINSNGSNKKDILSGLFDATNYAEFSKRLKEAAKQLNKLKDEKENEKRAVMAEGRFPFPEDMIEDDKLLFDPNHPQILNIITDLVTKEKKDKVTLETTKENLIKQKDKLVEEKAKADHQNQELDLLDSYLKTKADLDAKKPLNEEARVVYKLEEKAFHKVYPLDNEFKNLNDEIELVNKELINNNARLNNSKNKLVEAENNLKEAEQRNPEKEKLSFDIKNLNDHLADYQKLSNKLKEKAVMDDSLVKITNAIRTNEENSVKVKENLTNQLEKQTILTKSTANLTELKYAKENANKLYFDFSNDIAVEIQKHLKNLEAYQVNEVELVTLIKNKNDAYHNYEDLNDRLYKGQAGFLAQQLIEKIEKEKEAYCPVCHTLHHIEDVHNFEKAKEDVPTKEMVEAAKLSFDKAEEAYRKLENTNNQLNKTIELNKENVLKRLTNSNIAYSLENVFSLNYVDDTKTNLLADYNAKNAAYNKCEADSNSLNELNKLIENNQKAIKDFEENLKTLNENKAEVEKNLGILDTEIKNLNAILTEESEEAARIKISKLETEVNKIEKAINDARNNREILTRDISTLEAKISENNKRLNELTEKAKIAQEKFMMAIKNSEFANENAYRMIIAKIPNINNANSYLTKKYDELVKFDNDVKNNNERIIEQEEKTKGFVCQDVVKMQTEVDGFIKEINDAQEKINKIDVNVEIQTNIHNQLAKVNKELDKINPTYRRIKALLDVADPKESSDGGRYNFESYSLAKAFKEIVNEANIRLRFLSSGKYELSRRSEASKSNKVAGFDIDVLDVFTGESRDVGSLSGGEKFEVSLALALGLSDAVQKHANGNRIDSLFIDEGFGTLDEAILVKAKETLEKIAGDNKKVGIISHVAKLEEIIPQKIVVKNTSSGSKLHIEI